MTLCPSLRIRYVSLVIAALFVIERGNAQTSARVEPPAKPTVTGKFMGNGKNAALKFVAVEEHESFNGKHAITIILAEKDPAAAKKPSFDAMFGRLGSALVLNVFTIAEFSAARWCIVHIKSRGSVPSGTST